MWTRGASKETLVSLEAVVTGTGAVAQDATSSWPPRGQVLQGRSMQMHRGPRGTSGESLLDSVQEGRGGPGRLNPDPLPQFLHPVSPAPNCPDLDSGSRQAPRSFWTRVREVTRGGHGLATCRVWASVKVRGLLAQSPHSHSGSREAEAVGA